MTQPALAEATHGVVKQSEISEIETGLRRRIGLDKAAALADALGIDLDVFRVDAGMIEPDPSLEDFLRSDFGRGVTDEDRRELALARWKKGPAPVEAWYGLLQAIRLARAHRGAGREDTDK